MAWLASLTAIDWASLALPVLILLVWGLEHLYHRIAGRSPAPAPSAPLLSLSSGGTYAPSALSDTAVNQRSNQPVQFLLHERSQFIGPDAVATAVQLLDPTAPYDVIQGYLPADLLVLADLGYDLPPASALDPASLPVANLIQPHGAWLDENLPPLSSRVLQFMRLFVALLMLAPLLYRLFFP